MGTPTKQQSVRKLEDGRVELTITTTQVQTLPGGQLERQKQVRLQRKQMLQAELARIDAEVAQIDGLVADLATQLDEEEVKP